MFSYLNSFAMALFTISFCSPALKEHLAKSVCTITIQRHKVRLKESSRVLISLLKYVKYVKTIAVHILGYCVDAYKGKKNFFH